jgi:hypothetical protein
MKIQNSQTKEALRANKHMQKQNVKSSRNLTKDLYLTAISTIVCVLTAILLFIVLG